MKERIKISSEEFDNWMELPTTQRLLQYLEEEEFAVRSMLSEGGAIEDTPVKTGMSYMEYISTADVYRNLQALDYEQIHFSIEDIFNESETIKD